MPKTTKKEGPGIRILTRSRPPANGTGGCKRNKMGLPSVPPFDGPIMHLQSPRSPRQEHIRDNRRNQNEKRNPAITRGIGVPFLHYSAEASEFLFAEWTAFLIIKNRKSCRGQSSFLQPISIACPRFRYYGCALLADSPDSRRMFLTFYSALFCKPQSPVK